jgi:hypothetical protein
MTALGHSGDLPERNVIRISDSVPGTHLLPGVADTLREVDEATCQLDGVRYHFANGVLTFASPRGARVEVALLVDYVAVEVNDVLVATDITHPDQVHHERLRELLHDAFRVLNGLAAAVRQEKDDKRRATELAVRRALDSL